MTLDRANLKQLRLAIVAALLLVGTGVAALVFAETTLANAKRQERSVHAKLLAAQDRLAKVSEEEQAIRNNLARFKKFQQLHMTGVEERVHWIEAIAAFREKRGLFQVQYMLEPKSAPDYPGLKENRIGKGPDDVLFMASKLKLQMAALHEVDLLNFLYDLTSDSGSFATLRSCSISRTDQTFSMAGPLRPRLHANCVLDMITLHNPGKT